MIKRAKYRLGARSKRVILKKQTLLLGSLLAVGVSSFFVIASRASYQIDDSAGFFSVDFNNNFRGVDTSKSSNYQHDAFGGTVKAKTIPAVITTVDIQPTSFSGWQSVVVKVLGQSASADAELRFIDCSTAAPVGGVMGIYQSIPAGGMIDISSIPVSSDCIKAQVRLNTSAVTLDEIRVNYLPLPVLKVTQSVAPTKLTGEDITYSIQYSVSYSDDKDVVVWAPLPSTSPAAADICTAGSVSNSQGTVGFPGAYANTYPGSQPSPSLPLSEISSYTYASPISPIPTLKSANNGGIYTAASITGNGVNGVPVGTIVPAHSVYWPLGSVKAGTTATLTYTLATSNHLQNGIVYCTNAHADSRLAKEVVSDANKNITGDQPNATTLTSSAKPVIDKSVSGVIGNTGVEQFNTGVSQAPRVYNGGSYNGVVQYNLRAGNDYRAGGAPAPGTEPIFNPHIVDDVAEIMTKLITQCAVTDSAPALGAIIVPQSGGIYDYATKTITWSYPVGTHHDAKDSFEVSFTVDYNACLSIPANTDLIIGNNATYSGNNTAIVGDSMPVKIGIRFGIDGMFAKGDIVRNQEVITADKEDNVPGNGWDYTSTKHLQHVGETATYSLLATGQTNTPIVKDVWMFDKVPNGETFVSLQQDGSAGSAGYYTCKPWIDPSTPPDFTKNSAVGSHIITHSSDCSLGWVDHASTPPVSPSSVTGVAFMNPCVNSGYFPATGGSCLNAPITVINRFTTSIDGPEVCSIYEIENKAQFYAYQNSSALPNDDTSIVGGTGNAPITQLEDETELTFVEPRRPNFETGSSQNMVISRSGSPITGIIARSGDIITADFSITNSGELNAENTIVTIPTPIVLSNGQLKPLSFIGASGGTVTTAGSPVTNVTINLGTIPVGQVSNYQIKYSVPAGSFMNESFSINPRISTVYTCGEVAINQTVSGVIESTPKLVTFKQVEEALIPSGQEIHYSIQVDNIGSSPSTNTFVVDAIPEKTVFQAAYTNGVNEIGKSFSCVGCKVYFSKSSALPVGGSTSAQPLDVSDISAYFVVGREVSPGKWEEPLSFSKEEVLWVAYLIDRPGLTPELFPVGASVQMGLTVVNDQDKNVAGVQGSLDGSLVTNYNAVFSSELLQAIGNQVITTILPEPGVDIKKTNSTISDAVSQGEQFDWYIEYKNNSGSNDTSLQVSDTLPLNVSLVSVNHYFNETAIANGGGNVLLGGTSSIPVSVTSCLTQTALPDGRTEIEFNSVCFRGGDIANSEGGTLVLRVIVAGSPNNPTGTIITNTASGTAQNAGGTTYDSDGDSLIVRNPDLFVTKNVDRTTPVAGDEISYTVSLTNMGYNHATSINLADILPPGFCYVTGSASLSGDSSYSLTSVNEGGLCSTGQTITFNFQGASPLAINELPGQSPTLLFTYKAVVPSLINAPIGTIHTNTVTASTPLPEDSVFPNSASSSVTIPPVNVYVDKTSVRQIAPGRPFTYEIHYGNSSRQSPATGVYVIDKLPTSPQAKLVSVAVSNAEVVCYSTVFIQPIFTSGVPCGSGANTAWSTTLTPDATFIAIDKGTLGSQEGPHKVLINMEAKTPAGILPSPGDVYSNIVTIYTNSIETTLSDNTNVTALNPNGTEVFVPAADVTVTKEADKEGSFPGYAPGQNVTYTITYTNAGNVKACGVKLSDQLDLSVFEVLSPFVNTSSFGFVELADRLATETVVLPVDNSSPNGDPITTPVPVYTDYNSLTGLLEYYLGSASASVNTNVCLPPQTTGTFTITVKIKDSVNDSTTIDNSMIISMNGTETIATNNEGRSTISVWRPDVMVQKLGTSCGADNDCTTTADNNSSVVNGGEKIQYTITYDNIGNTDAMKPVLLETIPENTCYVVDSLGEYYWVFDDLPAGTYPEFSTDGVNFNYFPVGSPGDKDCAVKYFRIVWTGNLPAPANYIGENYDGTRLLGTSTNIEYNSQAQGLKLQGPFSPILNVPNKAQTVTSYDMLTLDDMNGDGKGDIYVSRQNGSEFKDLICVTVPSPEYYQCYDAPFSSSDAKLLSDRNGDGKREVVIAYTSAESFNTCLSQPVAPYFACELSNTPGASGGRNIGWSVEVPDINSDGRSELYINYYLGTDYMCTSLTAGTYSCVPVVSSDTLNTGNEVMLTDDVNGDARLDLYINGQGDYDQACLSQPTTPYFTCLDIASSDQAGASSYNVLMDDLNGDGKKDIFANSSMSWQLDEVCLTQASSPYYTCSAVPTGNARSESQALVPDLNGDGKQDVYINGDFDQDQICLTQASSPYIICTDIATSNAPSSSSVEVIDDVNADSVQDVYINNTYPNFDQICVSQIAPPYYNCSYVNSSSTGGSAAYPGTTTIAEVADTNSDGRKELVIVNTDSNYELCISSVTAPYFICQGLNINGVGASYDTHPVSDLNGDGISDAYLNGTTVHDATCVSISTYPYSQCQVIPSSGAGESYTSQVIPDRNGDGIEEIYTVYHYRGDPVNSDSYCLSQPAAPYYSCYDVPVASGGSDKVFASVVLSDHNADGASDMYVLSRTGNDEVCLSQPVAPYYSCSVVTGTSGGGYYDGQEVSDVNSDGLAEVYLNGSFGTQDQICLSQATSPYFSCTNISTGTAGSSDSLVVSDRNGDGKQDVYINGDNTQDEICLSQVAPPYFTCSTVGTSAMGGSTNSLLVSDRNFDGIEDIYINSYSVNDEICLSQAAAPYYACSLIGTSGSDPSRSSQILADRNGDGISDIYINGDGSGAVYNAKDQVCISQAAAPYYACSNIPNSGNVGSKDSVLLTDVNDDGAEDVFIASINTAYEQHHVCLSQYAPPYYTCSAQPIKTSGSYQVSITQPADITSWDKLLVDDTIPSGSNIQYSLYASSACTGTPVFGPTNIDAGYLNIASLGTTGPLCLRADFELGTANVLGEGPVLKSWTMTYKAPSPSFDFEVAATTTFTNAPTFTIPNTVSIQTESPEITTGNNSDTYTMRLLATDVEVTKSVDKAAVNLASLDTDPSGRVTYTIAYKNNGPADAAGFSVSDILPGIIDPLSLTILGSPTSGAGPSVTPLCALSVITIRCAYPVANSTNWILRSGEEGVITVSGIMRLVYDDLTCKVFENTTPLSIPDNDPTGVTQTISAPAVNNITDVDVLFDISHTNTYDLTASLISPSATTVNLFEYVGYGNTDLLDITLDDQSTNNPINWSSTGITGSYKPGNYPSNALAAFNGESSTSDWTFKIADQFDWTGNATGGTLNRVGLRICGQYAATTQNGDLFANTAKAETTTLDINATNNTSTVSTTITDAANVYIGKDARISSLDLQDAETTTPNGIVTYQLRVGNNGNLAANDVVITDSLNTSYFDATTAPTVTVLPVAPTTVSDLGSLSCSFTGLDLSCGGVGTTFAVGAQANIFITAHVKDDIALLTIPRIVVPNIATIDTSSSETSISDNSSGDTVQIAPRGSASLSGYVWLDTDQDVQREYSTGAYPEKALPGSSIYLFGRDHYGNTYFPDPDATPVADFALVLTAMQSQGLVSGLTTPTSIKTDYPNHILIPSSSTDTNGFYSFAGLEPSDALYGYSVVQMQPNAWSSTGSNGGYLGLDGSGNPVYDIAKDGQGSVEKGTANNASGPDVNSIEHIILHDGDNSIENNFGEVGGTIGTLVWSDSDSDGIKDLTENGIGSVKIEIFVDANNNDILDALETSVIWSGMTNDGSVNSSLLGTYITDMLPLGEYIVKVTDPNGVLTGLVHTIGTADVDDNSQGIPYPSGQTIVVSYPVSITSTVSSSSDSNSVQLPDVSIPSTLTIPYADFGYGGYSLGNRVWSDNGTGGGVRNNGIIDGAEQGISSVVVTLRDASGVQLYRTSSGTVTTNSVGNTALTLTTDTNGYYRFDNLPAGTYTVQVETSNFVGTGSPLYLYASSIVDSTDTTDGNDNGIGTTYNGTNGIRSNSISLGLTPTEPTGEIDLGPLDGTASPASTTHNSSTPDAQFNATVDFGFVPPVYDLSLVKILSSPSSGTIYPNTPITFTLRIKNQGDIDSGLYIVTDTLPSTCSFLYASDGGSSSSGIVTWNLSGLSAGASRDITVSCTLGLFAGSFQNWAEISSDSGSDIDSSPDTNTGHDSITPNDLVTDRLLLSDANTDLPVLQDEDDNDSAIVVVSAPAGAGITVDKKLHRGHNAGASCATPLALDEVVIVDATQAYQPITYCFAITNTSGGYLDNLVLDDTILGITKSDMTLLPVLSDALPLMPGDQLYYYYETSVNTSVNNTVDATMTPTNQTSVPTGSPNVTATDNTARLIYVFDPPYGVKTGTISNQAIEWRMVWVNDSTVTANNITISDQIPTNMTYEGSLICQAFGASVVLTCVYESPSASYPSGRVFATGNLAPNAGVTAINSSTASNRITVSFRAKPKDSVSTKFVNQAALNWDADNDGNDDFTVLSDDTEVEGATNPTSVVRTPDLTNTGLGGQYLVLIMAATGVLLIVVTAARIVSKERTVRLR